MFGFRGQKEEQKVGDIQVELRSGHGAASHGGDRVVEVRTGLMLTDGGGETGFHAVKKGKAG